MRTLRELRVTAPFSKLSARATLPRPRQLAVLAVALVVAACAGGSNGAPSISPDPLGSWPPQQGLGSPYPTTQPGVDVGVKAHGANATVTFGRLRFEVPAEWTYRPMNAYVKSITDVGFVGTANSRAGCFINTNSTMTTMSCVVDYRLRVADVSLLLRIQDGPGAVRPDDLHSDPATGAQVIDVGGIPGLLEPSISTQGLPGVIDRLLMLTVPDPQLRFWYRLEAAVRGDVDGTRVAAVMAAFHSVHFDPALVAPSAPIADQVALVRATLAQLRASDGSGYACFPETPGTERAARTRRFLGNGFETRERDVVCRADLFPDSSGDWLLTLTMMWNARADHVAATVRVRPDGSVGETTFDGTPPAD